MHLTCSLVSLEMSNDVLFYMHRFYYIRTAINKNLEPLHDLAELVRGMEGAIHKEITNIEQQQLILVDLFKLKGELATKLSNLDFQIELQDQPPPLQYKKSYLHNATATSLTHHGMPLYKGAHGGLFFISRHGKRTYVKK